MKTIKLVHVIDNHKIPRKFRKGYDFYIDTNECVVIPTCSGADWTSNQEYFNIHPVKQNTKIKVTILKSYYSKKYVMIKWNINEPFAVNKNLVVQSNKDVESVLDITDNTS